MKFYTVSDRYIAYLKTLDNKVPNNYGGKRPYVGIILQINGHSYLAPLTSYKPKQDNLDSSNRTIFKIHEKGKPSNKLGMLHLNNMIPVIESETTLVDFLKLDAKYKILLTHQIDFIKSEQDAIKERAAKLYHSVVVLKNAHFSKLSCDFSVLEGGYRNFVA